MPNNAEGYRPAPYSAITGENKSANRAVWWTIISLLVSSAIGIGAWQWPRDGGATLSQPPASDSSRSTPAESATGEVAPAQWFTEKSDSEFRIALVLGNCVTAGVDFDTTEGGVWRRTEDTENFDGVDLTWDVCMDEESMVEYTVAINNKDGNIPNEDSLGSKAASEEVPDAQSCVDRADRNVGGMLLRKSDNGTVIEEDVGTLCIHTPERLVMLALGDPLFPQGPDGEYYLMLRVSTWVSSS